MTCSQSRGMMQMLTRIVPARLAEKRKEKKRQDYAFRRQINESALGIVRRCVQTTHSGCIAEAVKS